MRNSRPIQAFNAALLVAFSLIVFVSSAAAQPITVSPTSFLSGDGEVGAAVEKQEWPEIAAGGPGYLAVWQDMRPVLSGNVGSAGSVLSGNGQDIYGALLDAEGHVIKSPIIIADQGHNQTRPRVAWNGQNWLVVWTSQRPDWYFFEDIVGVRVSPDGEVLDAEPIAIRLENNDPANDAGSNPRLASDGTDWVVVWQDRTYQGFLLDLNISGVRISPDGLVIDPEPVVLYLFDGDVFGPEDPQIVWATDRYMLVWENFGKILARPFTAALQPIWPQPITVTNFGADPRLATNGTDFMIVTSSNAAYRLMSGGQVPDGAFGIDFDLGGQGWQPTGGDVAWDGSAWSIVFASAETVFSDSDVYQLKIGTDGVILPPGASIVQGSAATEWEPVIASPGDGQTQVLSAQRVDQIPEDIGGVHLGGLQAPVDVEVSTGLHRQAYVRFATYGDRHMATYISEGEGELRLFAQRLNATGGVTDVEPILMSTHDEGEFIRPDIASNETLSVIVWVDVFGDVLAQRVDAEGDLLDPQPIFLLANASARDVAVGALGDDFLVTYTYLFSGDQQYLKAFRVRGSDLIVLDAPFILGFNFALDPRVEALGNRWLVVWEDQVSHDRSDSTTAGVFVDGGGGFGASFAIDQAGNGDDPDIAVVGDRALIVWSDNASFLNSALEGRILLADGSFPGGEFLIADDNNEQLFPAAAWDGEEFVVAWVDYRTVQGVEHMRGDIWMARVDIDGNVIDVGGKPLTSGSLPEDLPDVAGASGRTVIAFSQLHGESTPEVQRLGTRVVGAGLSLSVTGSCPGSMTLEIAGAPPFGDVALAGATGLGVTVLQSGPCVGATLDLASPAFLATLTADSDGRIVRRQQLGAAACGRIVQALDLTACTISPAGSLP